MSDPTIKKVLLWIRSPSEKRQADQGRIFTIQEFKETLLFIFYSFLFKFCLNLKLITQGGGGGAGLRHQNMDSPAMNSYERGRERYK